MVCNRLDEKFRTRRRIEALRAPHALSIEQRSYNERNLPEQKRKSRRVPGWILAAIVWVCVGAMLSVLVATAVRALVK